MQPAVARGVSSPPTPAAPVGPRRWRRPGGSTTRGPAARQPRHPAATRLHGRAICVQALARHGPDRRLGAGGGLRRRRSAGRLPNRRAGRGGHAARGGGRGPPAAPRALPSRWPRPRPRGVCPASTPSSATGWCHSVLDVRALLRGAARAPDPRRAHLPDDLQLPVGGARPGWPRGWAGSCRRRPPTGCRRATSRTCSRWPGWRWSLRRPADAAAARSPGWTRPQSLPGQAAGLAAAVALPHLRAAQAARAGPRAPAERAREAPTVSVVVPARNEAGNIDAGDHPHAGDGRRDRAHLRRGRLQRRHLGAHPGGDGRLPGPAQAGGLQADRQGQGGRRPAGLRQGDAAIC